MYITYRILKEITKFKRRSKLTIMPLNQQARKEGDGLTYQRELSKIDYFIFFPTTPRIRNKFQLSTRVKKLHICSKSLFGERGKEISRGDRPVEERCQ